MQGGLCDINAGGALVSCHAVHRVSSTKALYSSGPAIDRHKAQTKSNLRDVTTNVNPSRTDGQHLAGASTTAPSPYLSVSVKPHCGRFVVHFGVHVLALRPKLLGNVSMAYLAAGNKWGVNYRWLRPEYFTGNGLGLTPYSYAMLYMVSYFLHDADDLWPVVSPQGYDEPCK